MLDVSYTAVHCGLVSVFCKNIRQMLDKLPRSSFLCEAGLNSCGSSRLHLLSTFRDTGEPKSSLRVGFATYDHTIHFYNLKSAMGQPQMLRLVNPSSKTCAMNSLFTLKTSQSLLTEIETMFAETRITETMLGPVIEAGLDALKCADRAGKLFIFHTNLPIMDAPGKLKNRDDRKLLGTDKERGVLQPAIDYYGKLGEECVKSGCAVDLFLFPNAFVDVASISPVCTISGGSLYKYHYFEVQRDGLRPTGFFGSFFMDNSTDMEFGAVDSDKAVHVEIRHDDRLPEGNAYIQSASLFTSCSGQRRLRIHNMALPVSSDYNQLYRVADSHCLVSFLFKQGQLAAVTAITAESMVREKSPKEVRDSVTSRCAQMLATYREKCSSDVTVDDRAWMMQLVASLRIEDTMLLLYPNIFPISDLALDQPTDEIAFPASVRASYDNLSAEKAYVIYNGLMISIFAPVVTQFFETSQTGWVRRVLERINMGRARRMKLFVIRQQDALEAWMKRFLVEDRSSNMPSYVDYLCNIHREIRSLLSFS
uniref:Sec23/Sec24 trunk domain-containing protein n=1 Tax=Parascaris equorum TaxID=6256 RepID=A0A914RJ53_PAREQ